jgi:pimeloyl-ACP methyl ester carboxylesterase
MTWSHVPELAYDRRGHGPALVLIHGLGSSRRVWDPVMQRLAEKFDVLAVDLPGFGGSAPLPSGTPIPPSALAAAVGGLLDDLGIGAAHLVGNSLGGWVALELAGTRRTASVTLLSPAGLWSPSTPLYCKASVLASRWITRHAAGPLPRIVAYRWGRVLVLGQSHGRPSRMTVEQARTTISAMGGCPGFEAAFAGTARGYRAERLVEVPFTLAFGSRDLILLPRSSRRLDRLPLGTPVESLPGCGHFPTYDDPVAVADLIDASAARAGHEPSTHAPKGPSA